MRRLPFLLALVATRLLAQSAESLPTDAAAVPDAAAAAGNAASSRTGAVEALTRAVNINSLESGTLLQIINKAFDTNSDSINPEDGTMSWKGHSYDLGQFRVFRGRFERYLALPSNRDQDVYAATLDEIFKLLSTRNVNAGAQENIVEAWTLLYRAAEYDADGGNSLGVANQIFNAWRIRDEKQALSVTQNELQRLRSRQSASVVYGADTMQRETGRAAGSAASSAGAAAANAAPNVNIANTGRNNSRTTSSGDSQDSSLSGTPTVGMTGQMFRARELAETEAKIKALEAAGLLTVTQAKIQFQSQILSLFLQRRFQHALIASSFYRYIFRGSHQNLEVGKKELSSFLPSSDIALTIETIEFLSREAINDVNAGMAAVRASYEDNRKIAALERLQETFFLGEYLPAVTQFENSRKNDLLALYRKIDEARKLADLRDYDAVVTLIDDIGSLTGDFRSAEVSAAVRSAQRMSTLSLNAAQQAAAVGDYAKAQEFVEKAAQLWPLNPAIRSYTENMASQADLGTQAAALFDDALKRDDFRRIYERRAELAVAFLNDNLRGPQLRTVIDRMARVEIYLAQTEELLAQNNAYAAWEALAAAANFAPNDVVLNQRMAQLAPRVAEFVGRLDQAKRYEADRRYAASLTQYLAAQDIHPASQLARTGLTRVSEEIMNQLSTGMPASVDEK